MLMNIGYTIFDRHAKDGGVHSFLNSHDFLLCFFADFAVIGCFAHVWKVLSVFYFVKVMGIIDRNSFFNPSAPTPAKDLPVMIGIFINPGWCPEELKEPQQWEAPQGVGIEAPAVVVAPPAKYSEAPLS